MLVGRLGVLLLHFKQPLDGGGSGDLLANWFVRPEVGFWSLMGQEFRVLLEEALNDFNREGLMRSRVAGLALVATPMGDPLVFVGLPWSLALVDESLLVLLCGVPCSAYRLVVDVVLWISVYLFESGCWLFIDLQVILV